MDYLKHPQFQETIDTPKLHFVETSKCLTLQAKSVKNLIMFFMYFHKRFLLSQANAGGSNPAGPYLEPC